MKADLFVADPIIAQCQAKKIVAYRFNDGLEAEWQQAFEEPVACALVSGIQQLYPFALFDKGWIQFQKRWQQAQPTLLVLSGGCLSALNLQNRKKEILWELENGGVLTHEHPPLLKIIDLFIDGRWSRLLVMSIGPQLIVWEISEALELQFKWKVLLEGDIKDFAGGRAVGQGWQLIVLSQSKNAHELEVKAYGLDNGFQRNHWFFKNGHFAKLYLMDSKGLGEFTHAFIFASQQKVGIITFENRHSGLLPIVMPKKWESVHFRGMRQGYQLVIQAKEGEMGYEFDENLVLLRSFHLTFDETGDCSLYLRGRQLLCSWCLTEKEGNAVAAQVLVDPFFDVDVGLATYYFD